MGVALVLGSSLLPQASGSARFGTAEQSGGDHTVHLPLVVNQMRNTQPGSVELIDEAVADGRIDAETGLIYKMYATFSDPRLPAEYVGSGIGPRGDGIVRDVMDQADAGALSDEAIGILAPFFVPPDRAGSWYEVQRSLRAAEIGSQSAMTVTWMGLDAVGGKAQFLWPADFHNGPSLAAELKKKLEADIWPQLTGLMETEPKPDDTGKVRIFLCDTWTDTDGTIVPFDPQTAGVTVPGPGTPIPTTIYLRNDLPLIGSATQFGLSEVLAHEFMHAIQFRMGFTSQAEYGWLMESTAVWAQDAVYEDTNTEWQYVRDYMDELVSSLDATYPDLHQYGTYLLPYFLTHTVDPTEKIIRDIWVNAGTMDNSYLAIRDAVPEGVYRDTFWDAFIAMLWNKAPFDTYYKDHDGLTDTPRALRSTAVELPASGAPFEDHLHNYSGWATGSMSYWHFTFPDPDVRSVTLLNGLAFDLAKGSMLDDDEGAGEPVLASDQTYLRTEASAKQAAGVTVVWMIKVAGDDQWQVRNLGQVPHYSYCVDEFGRIEELVIAVSNADWEKQSRVMWPKGEHMTLYATDIPCWRYQGTSKITTRDYGLTWTYEATDLVLGAPDSSYNFSDDYNSLSMAFPITRLGLRSAQGTWSVSGTDVIDGCKHEGSGTFSVDVPLDNFSYLDGIALYPGILPGGPSYRGYSGWAMTDGNLTGTYTVTCDEYTESRMPGDDGFLYIPLEEDRANVKVSTTGRLSGSYKDDFGDGNYIQYDWNLTPRRNW